MIPRQLTRLSYCVLAILTIALGLYVHAGGGALGPVAQDVLGDALWAMMIFWGFGALFPRRPVVPRSVAALSVCIAVELSQLLHGSTIDALRRTTIGGLVFGSGFDSRDLLAYALGVGAAALLEWCGMGRRARPGEPP